MNDTNITMVRGDTLSFGFEYDGTEQDLDAASFFIKVSDTRVPVQRTLGDGIEKYDTGKYIIRVAPDDTRRIIPGTYKYDFQVELNGDVFTLLQGSFIIEDDETILTGGTD